MVRRAQGSNQYRAKITAEHEMIGRDLIEQAGAASGRSLIVPGARHLATFPALDWLPPGARARLFSSTELPASVECSSSCGLITNRLDQLLLVRVVSRGWDIPGGHTDPDESPVQTMVRETAEEAGVEVSDPETIGYLTIEKPHEPPAFIAFYSGEAHGEPQPHPEYVQEVDQAQWVDASQVITLAGQRVWTPLWRHTLER